MTKTIELPTQCFAASVVPDSVDVEERTVRCTWSTGQKIPMYSYRLGDHFLTLGLEPENVRLGFARSGAPVLDSHSMWSTSAVKGVIEEIDVDGETGTALLRFSQREDVEPIWQDVRDGILRFVSVGTIPHRLEDITEDDDSYPSYLAIDHEPIEISLAPVPRDRGAVMQSEDGRSPNLHSVVIEEKRTMSVDPNSPAPKAEEIRLAERERVSEIVELCSKAEAPATLSLTLIDDGKTVDEARKAVLEFVASRDDATACVPYVTMAGGLDEADRREHERGLMAEGLASRWGFKARDEALPFAGWSTAQFAEASLRFAGVSTMMMGRDRMITQALHSSSDFPQILAIAAEKRLRSSYEAAMGGAQALARQSSARDFRAKSIVQLGEAPELFKVGEAGEFKRGTMGEAAESYRVETYGRVFGLTRQALVNDDLDAFGGALAAFGQAARDFERKFIVDLVTSNPQMSDGNAVFSSAHANLAGTGAALSVATLGAARKAMRLQTGIDGKTLVEMSPTHLLVPAALETDAEQVLATIAATKVDDANPFSGQLQLAVDPRLDAVSEAAWYLVASEAEGVEYSYLEGAQGVQTFTREGFDVDGLEIKARLDFGAGWIDWRSWYRNDGA